MASTSISSLVPVLGGIHRLNSIMADRECIGSMIAATDITKMDFERHSLALWKAAWQHSLINSSQIKAHGTSKPTDVDPVVALHDCRPLHEGLAVVPKSQDLVRAEMHQFSIHTGKDD
jgi:hypothetical protein